MAHVLPPKPPLPARPLTNYAKEQEIFRAKARANKKRRHLRRLVKFKRWFTQLFEL